MNKEHIANTFAKPLWQTKPKLHRYPTKRWGHTAVIMKNKLYIYGGKTGKAKQPVYEIDCETYEAHILESAGLPQSRQSHSCTLIKDKLFIWGGCYQSKCTNDCLTLIVKDRVATWVPIAQLPLIKQRESHASLALQDKYILLYGGCDDDVAFNDFQVFNTEIGVWFEIKHIANKFQNRLSCTMTLVKNKVFLFGGELKNGGYFNELINLQFSSLKFDSTENLPSLQCQKIMPKGKSPPPRSSHCAVAYDKYLLILGGQGADKDNNSILLNDVWAYDTIQNNWIEIEVNKTIFKARSCFTANVYENKVFIYGGLITLGNFRSSDELLVVSFTNPNDMKLSICNSCQLQNKPFIHQEEIKDIAKIETDNTFKMGTKALYKLSKCIKNPLDALSLMVQGYNQMNYKELSIDISQKAIIIQGSGYLLNQQQFEYISNNYEFVDQMFADSQETDKMLPIIYGKNLKIFNANIKNGSSRLGSSWTVINKRQNMLDLLYVTPQSRTYSQVDGEDFSVGQRYTISYEIISKHLKAMNINISLIQENSLTLVITNMHQINNLRAEICQFQIAHIENHLKYFFLPRADISLSVNGQLCENLSITDQFRNLPEYETLDQEEYADFRIKLRECSDKYRQHSNVYVYMAEKKVWEFKDKQYPLLEGSIVLPVHKFQMNIMRTRLEPISQKNIQKSVRAICRQFTSEAGKRKGKVFEGVQRLNGKKSPIRM